MKAENPYTTPGAPTDVKIVDFDENSVTLRWKKPATDGGREISNYIIQKKDEFGGWFEALVTTDANCCATIAELEARVPGLRYISSLISASESYMVDGGGVGEGTTKPNQTLISGLTIFSFLFLVWVRNISSV